MLSDEQAEFRKGKLGASDAGAALGLNKWKSPAQLWHEILHGKQFDDTLAARVGNHMEPFIAEEYTKLTGIPLSHSDETVVHPKHEWMIAHPDYLTETNDIIEIKNVGPHMRQDWGSNGDPDGVPPYYVVQCAVQANLIMLSNDMKQPPLVNVVAYMGGNDLKTFPLGFDKGYLKNVEEMLVGWWEKYVVTKKEPPFNENDVKFANTIYPLSSDIEAEADSTALAAFNDMLEYKKELDSKESAYNYCKAQIKQFMQKRDKLMYDGKLLCTWRTNRKGVRVFKTYQ